MCDCKVHYDRTAICTCECNHDLVDGTGTFAKTFIEPLDESHIIRGQE
jgi:hypothetical protein